MAKEQSPNMDEAVRQMMAQDELDAAREGLTKMTVIEYGRARNIQPQLIYYWVRQGYVKQEQCICGRKVIDVVSADAHLGRREAKTDADRSGVELPGRTD